MTDKTLHQKLIDIQQRLKVPKEQRNDFGGFEYRNLEDIEDKVKPLLNEHSLSMVFQDEIVAVGDRIYVKATVTLGDGENTIQTSAFAREAVAPRAKTDDAQLTGSCSSYARKYAASGLFLIDNTKDADSTSHAPVKSVPAKDNKLDELNAKKGELYKDFLGAGIKTMEDQKLYINSVLGKETIEISGEVDMVLIALREEYSNDK